MDGPRTLSAGFLLEKAQGFHGQIRFISRHRLIRANQRAVGAVDALDGDRVREGNGTHPRLHRVIPIFAATENAQGEVDLRGS